MKENLTFGQKVIEFNRSLDFDSPLPAGVGILNPFRESDFANSACDAFYNKYYNDQNERRIILGINPGRFGAGLTGVPFTDPKRLKEDCGIIIDGCPRAHEPSSQFVYEAIAACGGPEQFYGKWYINSLCPLGFTKPGKTGKPVNFNYYDSAELCRAAVPFILKTLEQQLSFGVSRDICICFGTGKNALFLNRLNAEYKFFGEIIALEHPRYIIQYKSAELAQYVRKYADTFRKYG